MSDLIRDMSIPDLREHLNNWWKDRASQSTGGNFNDHQYLMLTINGLVQDAGELFNILLGVLDRLEADDPVSDLVIKSLKEK